MQEDLRRGLISKKTSNFDKLHEECLVKIQRIKQKNDIMQKQIGTDMDDIVSEEINNQSEYVEKEINQLKNLMQQIETKYKDPESKNKLKQIKLDAQKQIERNKIILKDLINRSFVRKSAGRSNNKADNSQNYIQGGIIDYKNLNGKKVSAQQSQLTEQQQQIEIDYQIQRKIMLQKNQMINEVEQSANRINQIMNDMGVMVEDQGKGLDIISDEMMKAKDNVVAANENIVDANQYQKKARKKYTCLVILIIIVVLVAAGLIFIFVS